MPNNTIFDDVFRTMVEKMPELVIPVLNEVFGTNYPKDTKYEHLRNEHQLPDGEIITDSCFRIGKHLYHIECQSSDDKTMAIRMVEYDFHIALENAEQNGREYVMEFPKSCVLYVRQGKNIPDSLSVKVIFPDQSVHTYSIPTLKVSEYSEDEIIKKNLFFFLPFYILRYENVLSQINGSKEKTTELTVEYRKIGNDINNIFLEDSPGLLLNLMRLIKEVADYVLRNHPTTRKELDLTMGGKILELESERIYKKGNSDGMKKGQQQIIQLMSKVSDDERDRVFSGDSECIDELLLKYHIQ